MDSALTTSTPHMDLSRLNSVRQDTLFFCGLGGGGAAIFRCGLLLERRQLTKIQLCLYQLDVLYAIHTIFVIQNVVDFDLDLRKLAEAKVLNG